MSVDQASPATGFSHEDRVLIQTIGNQLRKLLQGQELPPLDVNRRDELGILAGMVNRVARELALSRRRDEQQRRELEQRLAELEAAYATQQQLMETIGQLSTPILDIYAGVLLLPLIGTIDSARAARIIETLLERIAATRARIVILDITGVVAIDTHVAGVLLKTAQAAALLGARVILCGIAPEVARVIVGLGVDLSQLTPASDLRAALVEALEALNLHICPAH